MFPFLFLVPIERFCVRVHRLYRHLEQMDETVLVPVVALPHEVVLDMFAILLPNLRSFVHCHRVCFVLRATAGRVRATFAICQSCRTENFAIFRDRCMQRIVYQRLAFADK